MSSPEPAQPQVKSTRLVGTLAVAGMLAGILIVSVFQKTLPAIEAHKAFVLEQSIQEVLQSPDRLDTLYVVNGALTPQAPPGKDAAHMERIFAGYRGDELVGYAISAAEPGFQDMITLIFGYDNRTGRLLAMKVLESKETPGLGDKIEKDPNFVAGFADAATPIVGTKAGQSSAPEEVDMITGATISSRSVIRIINNKVERLKPMLDAYEVAS